MANLLEFYVILRQMPQMTMKWLQEQWLQWTLQGQKYTICVLLEYSSPKFHSLLLHDEPYLRYMYMVVKNQKNTDWVTLEW